MPAKLHEEILNQGIFQEVLINSENEWDIVRKKSIIEKQIKYKSIGGDQFAIFEYRDIDCEIYIPYNVYNISKELYINLRNDYTGEVTKLEEQGKAIVLSDYY